MLRFRIPFISHLNIFCIAIRNHVHSNNFIKCHSYWLSLYWLLLLQHEQSFIMRTSRTSAHKRRCGTPIGHRRCIVESAHKLIILMQTANWKVWQVQAHLKRAIDTTILCSCCFCTMLRCVSPQAAIKHPLRLRIFLQSLNVKLHATLTRRAHTAPIAALAVQVKSRLRLRVGQLCAW